MAEHINTLAHRLEKVYYDFYQETGLIMKRSHARYTRTPIGDVELMEVKVDVAVAMPQELKWI